MKRPSRMRLAVKPAAAPKTPTPPLCLHCSLEAVFVASSAEFYNGRDFGPVWACRPCAALVGCHKGTHNALGSPANKLIRDLRQIAHARFDPLWEAKVRLTGCSKGAARRAAYAWLAGELRIEPKHCHISWMGPEALERVIAVCDGVRVAAQQRRGAERAERAEEVNRA